MHAAPVELSVGACEVHELEQAEPRLDSLERERTHRPRPGRVDDDHLAGVELTDEVGTDDVERGRLGGEHPAAVEAPEAEGAEAVGVAHADDVLRVGEHERERSLELGEHRVQRDHERRLDTVVRRRVVSTELTCAAARR